MAYLHPRKLFLQQSKKISMIEKIKEYNIEAFGVEDFLETLAKKNQ